MLLKFLQINLLFRQDKSYGVDEFMFIILIIMPPLYAPRRTITRLIACRAISEGFEVVENLVVSPG